jgi:uncharacterized protein (DUF1778 family)
MPPQAKKKSKTQLGFRLDTEAKQLILQAAHISEKSVSEFAVSALIQSAQKVLENHQAITFSNRDFDAFLDAIESEEKPNVALKRAAERYQLWLAGRDQRVCIKNVMIPKIEESFRVCLPNL